MKLVDLSNPIALATIIANSNANSIAVNATGTSYASQEEGFPHITMIPEEQGGEAPHGLDFNGFMKLLSSHVFNIQNGSPETFNPAVSTLIGGYPKNAQLWLIDDNNSRLLKSTKDDNTDNFLTTPSYIGTSWIDAFPTQDYVDNTFVTKTTAQTITGAKTFTGSNYVKDQFLHYTTDRIAYTETPTDSNVYWGLNCLDKNDAEVSAIYSAYYTDGRGLTGFNLKNHAGDTERLSLRFNDSGTFYTEAPTPTDTTTTSGTQIATTGWVNTVGNNVVHRTGDESITGRKNFVGGYNNVRLSCTTNDTTGNNNYTDIAFYNNSGSTKNAYIRANNLGNLYLSATDAVTAPASDKADSILITVAKSKAQNGYFKLGNGLIIQWGRTQINVVTGGSHTPTTITLPIAFSGTNFSFTGTFEQNTSTSPSNTDDVSFCTTSITTTNVKGFGYDSGGNTYKAYLRWIAIGY